MKTIIDEVSFYTDKLQPTKVYVEYPLHNGCKTFAPIESHHFKAFLVNRYFELYPDEEDEPDYDTLLLRKASQAIYFPESRVTIHHRIAGNMHKVIYYYLSDENCQSVKITSNGWKLVNATKVKFLPSMKDLAQVLPVGGGDYLNLMLPRLNMDRDDALLFAVYIVQAFSRSSSHFCAVISSGKGTGKSTLTKMVTDLIAPTISSCAITPTTTDALITSLANSYLVSFDNTARLSAIFSDILCAAITGTKAEKRKLYSDATPLILSLHSLILINGIDIVPYRSDLAERCLYFTLNAIPASERRTDAEIWGSFEEDKPKILGAIFDTIVKAMQILPTLQMPKLHRMSDAHKEMTAIALALGISQDEFQRLLDKNCQKLRDAYAVTDPFVSYLLEYLAKQPCDKMPVSKLFSALRAHVIGNGDFLPKSPSALSRRLNQERETIESLGYTMSFDKTPTANIVTIKPIPKSKITKAQQEAMDRRNELLNN